MNTKIFGLVGYDQIGWRYFYETELQLFELYIKFSMYKIISENDWITAFLKFNFTLLTNVLF